jgi:PAS domain S-box-containing protein
MREVQSSHIPEAQLLHRIFDGSPIAIAIEDLDGQPFFLNPAFCRSLGFTEEELCNKHCVDFSPPEDAKRDWELFQQLRAGLITHYQLEKRYFRRDGSLVWGRLSVSLATIGPALCVFALIDDITEKKNAEQALLESEERLRLAVAAGNMFAYSWDLATDLVERSGESSDLLGLDPEELATGAAVSAMIHPDDRRRVEEAIAKLTVADPWLRISYRLTRPDGALRWLERNSRAYFDENGKMSRMVGMVVDVTERKQTEEERANMTRKLVEAQEQERARIGRELHDDINQRIALLSVDLERLKQNPVDVVSRTEEIQQQMAEISSDLQALSHDLHASNLRYLGVVAGMRSWCKQFAQHQALEIHFESDVQCAVPLDIGLPLFRVLQEALHNCMKHSGSKRVEVQLRETSGQIQLLIRDHGKGFDILSALRGNGLGLTSMRERVRLVGGTLSIDSTPTKGTTVQASAPFNK